MNSRIFTRRPLAAVTMAVLVLLAVTTALAVNGNIARAQQKTLRIATKPIAPFVIQREEKLVGFSIDYWDHIAQRLGRTYEWAPYTTVAEVIKAVQDGQADVGIAAISMTNEREQTIDFTHGYFNGGLQIMVNTKQSSVLDSVMATLFSRDMLQLLALIAGVTLVFTHIIWLVERRTNADYPRSYFAGISAALWWTVVTLATVGDSERTPKHRIGKLLAILWMFLSIILIANFTAVATSTATLRDLRGSIQGIADLPGKKIATVGGTTAASYLTNNGYDFTPVKNIEEAYDLLRVDKVQAIIYDAPVLLYYANTVGRGYFEVVGSVFNPEQYGLALPTDSQLREDINRVILETQKDGTYQSLFAKWFGASN